MLDMRFFCPLQSLCSFKGGRIMTIEVDRYEAELSQVGDEVTVYTWSPSGSMYDENGKRHSFTIPFPNGFPGVIAGFSFHTFGRLQSPNAVRFRAPGLYTSLQYPYVRFADGRITSIDANHLHNRTARGREGGMRCSLPQPHYLVGERMCDLPETYLWEGDTVRISKVYAKGRSVRQLASEQIPGHPDAFRIMHVRFSRGTDLRESMNNEPHFSLTNRLFQYGLTTEEGQGRDSYWPESGLELVERGNLWRQFQGQPLVFGDLQEEATFFAFTRAFDEVTPQRVYNQYGERMDEDFISLEEARRLVQDGRGHGIVADFFEKEKALIESHIVLRFHDESLGQRVARATLDNGFFIHPRPNNR